MAEEAFVGLCRVVLYLPGVSSLKAKRRIVKSLMARMQNRHQVACAEVAKLDKWQSAVIAFAAVSNSTAHLDKRMRAVLRWMEANCPDAAIVDYETEIF